MRRMRGKRVNCHRTLYFRSVLTLLPFLPYPLCSLSPSFLPYLLPSLHVGAIEAVLLLQLHTDLLCSLW